MQHPKVSIIINNYNYGEFLCDAIDSALAQTYRSTEVIVVDDGSTDGSREIIESYKSRIYPIQKSNGGQGSAINAGFRQFSGEIVIFLDSDDMLDMSATEKSVEAFIENPDIVKYHWPLWQIDKYGKKTGLTVPSHSLVEGDLKEQLIIGGPSKSGGPPYSPPTSGNAWSANFLRKVLPMPEEPFKYGADDYLFVLAPLYGAIKKTEGPLGYYRVHGANDTLTGNYAEVFADRFEYCCQILSDHLAQEGIEIPSENWPRDHWFHLMGSDLKLICSIIPEEDSLILVDEDHWLAGDQISGRKRFHLTDKDGDYWGPPIDDASAIKEIEMDRLRGATHLVFTKSSFWYLDHYKDMRSHLASNYPLVLKNDRLIIYQLTSH